MNAKEVSESLATAVERAAPAVVRVEGRRRPSSGIVWSADGHVVTAAHTIHHEEGVTVTLADGRTLPAKVVGVDHGTDVALLKVDATLTEAPRTTEKRRVGELVVVLSRAGSGVRAGLGMVAAANGPWRTASGGRIDRWIEVDGALPPGASGGPLVDADGAVVGMNTSALARGGSTVPVETVERVVASLVAHGGVRRGWLGVAVQPVRLDEKQAATAGQERALLLVSVAAESPATAAGLQVGDVLLAFAGQAVADPRELHARLDESTVDAPVAVRLLRGGVVTEVQVTVGGRVAGHPHGCGR